MTEKKTINRALISVSDKTGIIDFAQQLAQLNIEILSTGGTFRLLKEHNIPVQEVSEYTQFPEIMDGRVKTLHPKIHGGILGRRGIDNQTMLEQSINSIDLVVVNLYPFADTISKPECSFELAIENIDIGGPTMIRAAAKNHNDVVVVVNKKNYDFVINELTEKHEVSYSTRFELALEAFQHTAEYDGMVANALGKIDAKKLKPSDSSSTLSSIQKSDFPSALMLNFEKIQEMRYGENPHQKAGFYKENHSKEASVSTSIQHQGKELSFNNIADTDAALECVRSLTAPSCVIVKHANPCGVASAPNCLDAYKLAFQTDPVSAFGGIIAFNRRLEENTAKAIIDKQFVEVIIAPEISPEALKICSAKSNIRLLSCGNLFRPQVPGWDYKRVNGGLLVQEKDLHILDSSALNFVTERPPTDNELTDLLFAWQVAQFVKSNAIVYVKDQQTIGIGAGQMSRVYSAKIAGIKAADENLTVSGSVMASDAFFPFRDGLDAAAEAGITAVIQPGGSIRDDEVIAAANEANIAMVFTGIRHFRH